MTQLTWRPIAENKTRDVTLLIVGRADPPKVAVAFRVKKEWRRHDDEFETLGWEPTHFMELPPPPSSEP